MPGAGIDDQPEFSEQPANPVKERGALFYPADSQAVPGQALLLGFGLDRDEAHAGRAQRDQDRFGVGPVVFDRLALAVRTHELGRHQPRSQAQALCRTAPMMGTAARFHADHRARRQRTEPGQKARPIELPPRHDPPGAIRHTGHEDILCQIHSNRRSIHFDFPPRRFRLTFSNAILAL